MLAGGGGAAMKYSGGQGDCRRLVLRGGGGEERELTAGWTIPGLGLGGLALADERRGDGMLALLMGIWGRRPD